MKTFYDSFICPNSIFGTCSPSYGYDYGDGYGFGTDEGNGFGRGREYENGWGLLSDLRYNYPYELIIY